LCFDFPPERTALERKVQVGFCAAEVQSVLDEVCAFAPEDYILSATNKSFNFFLKHLAVAPGTQFPEMFLRCKEQRPTSAKQAV
jgi:hypothetical protein